MKCKEKHLYYVLFCKHHSFGADHGGSARDERIKDGLSRKVCGFCFPMRYLLNFKCFKICVEEVPGNFIERVVSLDLYFTKMKCEPFFFRSKKTKMIEIDLDNANKEHWPVNTDYKYMV